MHAVMPVESGHFTSCETTISHKRCLFVFGAGLILVSLSNYLKADQVPQDRNDQPDFSGYAGSASCRECHSEAYNLWAGSHHAEAERAVQTNRDRVAFDPPREFKLGTKKTSVQWCNGQAEISSYGYSHHWETNVVARVIGEDPLRQFLISFPGGRWQVQEASYAPRTNKWFDVFGDEDRQPGEWGNWMGRGMNWNSMCAACHNTSVQKNYDASTDTYHTAMAEPTVSCEACHGPLKKHVDWEKKQGGHGQKDPYFPMLSRQQVFDMCASCHARRTDLTGTFRPGERFFDHFEPSIVDNTDLFYPDGQNRGEDYELSSFLGSKMQEAGLTCLDCHPRSLHMARLHGNALCMQCHTVGGANSKAPPINPTEHSHHAEGNAGNECANCHMPQTVYMQCHWRHDHGFTIPDPLLTKQFGIPNACNRCHADKSTEWALKNVVSWYGEKMQRHTRERAQIIARARTGEEASRTQLVQLLQTEKAPYWRAVAGGLLENWAGDKDVTPALIKGLDDTNALVRSSCVRALEPLAQNEDVVGAITKRLADPVRNVRIAAAWSLREGLDTNSIAGKDLLRMLEFNADQPLGQLQLGNYYFARGNLPAANQHMQTAVTWDGFSTPLRLNFAVVLSATGQLPKAVEQLKIASRNSPRDAEVHYSLGLALNEQGDSSAALKELQTAVEIDPRDARAWYNLGLLQNSTDQSISALASLRRGEQADPADARIPYARATILAHMGRQAEARAELKRCLELHPENEDARKLLDTLSAQSQ